MTCIYVLFYLRVDRHAMRKIRILGYEKSATGYCPLYDYLTTPLSLSLPQLGNLSLGRE